MDINNKDSETEFFVGQRGSFTLLDSFLGPIEDVKGEIVQLMDGKNVKSIYSMILTERGIRPARLK